jgi:hypothetical protein
MKREPRNYTLPELVFWSLIVWTLATLAAAVAIASQT